MKGLLTYIVFVLVAVSSCTHCFCQKVKDIKPKVIREADVISFLPKESDSNPASFWKFILEEKTPIKEELDKVHNKKGLAQKARIEVAEAAQKNNSHYQDVETDIESLDGIKNWLLGESNGQRAHIKLAYLSGLNAFATPLGKITVYSDLVDLMLKEDRFDCLVAIITHEVVHVMLEHTLVSIYHQKKKERSNNILAGIAVGLQAFADGYSSGLTGQYKDNTAYYRMIFNMAQQSSYMYQFKYSREIELQADIVAFRLLDWIGFDGESLIDALLLIKDPFEYYSDTDNHYTIEQRVKALRTIAEGERVKGPSIKPNKNDIKEEESIENKEDTSEYSDYFVSSSKEITIYRYEKIKLITTKSEKAKWTSDNPGIATVTDDGIVTGIAPGTTTICANKESGNELFKVCVK